MPSHKDVHHVETLPMQPFLERYFSFMTDKVTLASNPDIIQLNDMKIGFFNADAIKDLCQGSFTKNKDTPKIDLALQNILEQRTFYPMYPPTQSYKDVREVLPIDYSQMESLMFGD